MAFDWLLAVQTPIEWLPQCHSLGQKNNKILNKYYSDIIMKNNKE